MPTYRIIKGDSEIELLKFADNSIDSIVCDPPYGLDLLGKKWDAIVPKVAIWKECLRVLKPGGHLLAFAGTRTQHRLVVNIEDAGFEIRDMLLYLYGTGFPKSLNIAKSIESKILTGSSNKTAFKYLDGEKSVSSVGYNKLQNEHNRPNNYNGRETTINQKLHTEQAQKYDGWGTALKPAIEPITLARKPIIEKTIAENIIKYGTGGININDSRIEYKDKEDENNSKSRKKSDKSISGRYPSNLIIDDSESVIDIFSQGKNKANPTSRYFYCAKASKSDRDSGMSHLPTVGTGTFNGNSNDNILNDGNQPQGKNTHPTVKPISLMRYLVKLVTPKNGTVLDPFMGSGSTGKACMLEDFDFIGIDREEEYCSIAKVRIEHAQTKKNEELF